MSAVRDLRDLHNSLRTVPGLGKLCPGGNCQGSYLDGMIARGPGALGVSPGLCDGDVGGNPPVRRPSTQELMVLLAARHVRALILGKMPVQRRKGRRPLPSPCPTLRVSERRELLLPGRAGLSLPVLFGSHCVQEQAGYLLPVHGN